MIEDPLALVKEGLLDRWAPKDEEGDRVPIGDLKAVLPYERKQAVALPQLTMQTRGFNRAGLENPVVRSPIQDPLGGRRWVWRLWVRVWVGIKSDEVAAQEQLDALIPQVVQALEEDRSLNGVAVDAVLEAGDAVVVTPQSGESLMMLTCECAVETEEPLT